MNHVKGSCQCGVELESPCSHCQESVETTIITFNAKGWPVRIIVNDEEPKSVTSLEVKWAAKGQTVADVKIGVLAIGEGLTQRSEEEDRMYKLALRACLSIQPDQSKSTKENKPEWGPQGAPMSIITERKGKK